MSEKKLPTYAANNKQIARALGLKTSRKALAQIGQWRLQADFPAKQRRGYLVAELREWRKVSGARCQVSGAKVPSAKCQVSGEKPDTPHLAPDTSLAPDTFSTAQIKAAREQAIVQSFAEGKPLEKFNDEQRAVLQKRSLITSEELASPVPLSGPAANGVKLKEKVTTQKAILPELQLHYRGRLENEITTQNISDWHNGKNPVDPEATAAPHKEGNYFIIAQWIEWFDRWVLPYWALDAPLGQADLFGPGAIARLRREDDREDLLHRKFLRETEYGLYVRKSILGPLAQGIGQKISAEITQAERVLPLGLAADLQELGVGEELRQRILAKFTARCRAWNDCLQTGIPGRLQELAQEREQDVNDPS